MQVQVAEGQVVVEAGKASSISPPAGGGGKVGDWSEGGVLFVLLTSICTTMVHRCVTPLYCIPLLAK